LSRTFERVFDGMPAASRTDPADVFYRIDRPHDPTEDGTIATPVLCGLCERV
jgi:hypothetical protein